MSPLLSSHVKSGVVPAAVILALVYGCAKSGDARPEPRAPEAVVTAFLTAVNADRINEMGELWGTSKGPASRTMDTDELEQRLRVIRTYLVHDKFEFVQGSSNIQPSSSERRLNVKLYRNGCEPVVPMTVIKYRSGWLIREIDLAAAGNPARRCQSRDSAEPDSKGRR